MDEKDEDIHTAALWLMQIFSHIERYPRPSSVAKHIDEIRRQVENLAFKAYKGD